MGKLSLIITIDMNVNFQKIFFSGKESPLIKTILITFPFNFVNEYLIDKLIHVTISSMMETNNIDIIHIRKTLFKYTEHKLSTFTKKHFVWLCL